MDAEDGAIGDACKERSAFGVIIVDGGLVDGDERAAFDFEVIVKRCAEDEGDDSGVNAPDTVARGGEGDAVPGDGDQVEAEEEHEELEGPGVEKFQVAHFEIFADGDEAGTDGDIEADEHHQRDPEDHVVECVAK